MRILVVEDEADLNLLLRKVLTKAGYTVDGCRDGEEAQLHLLGAEYDAILLDVMMPKKDGYTLVRELREAGNDTPVLFLTARDSVSARAQGLDLGAAPYLVKPFELDELAARMRAVLRRHAGRAAPVLQHAGITLDPATRQVARDGAPVLLSAREFALLEALMARAGAILSRQQLEDKLYGWGEEVESNTVSVYIHQLRRKLGADVIRTMRGLGYYLGQRGEAAAPEADA